MKKIILLLAAACSIFLLAGCGQTIDENKTPDQIRNEVANLPVEDIQDIIVKYQTAIEAKAVKLKAEAEKLSRIPLSEQLSEKARKLRSEMQETADALDRLKAGMAAYADGLKAKN